MFETDKTTDSPSFALNYSFLTFRSRSTPGSGLERVELNHERKQSKSLNSQERKVKNGVVVMKWMGNGVDPDVENQVSLGYFQGTSESHLGEDTIKVTIIMM